MNKFLTKFGFFCLIIVVLVEWNVIYNTYIFPDDIGFMPEYSWDSLLNILIPLGIKEEIIFRWIPILLSTVIIMFMRKKQTKWQKPTICFLVLFVLSVQIIFAFMHVPWDSVDREVLYNLPASPTFEELKKAFLLHGVVGIRLCISYIITIFKNTQLHLLQLYSVISSCFVQMVYIQLLIVM